MILHENRLPSDNSHEISCLICYFLKSGKIFNCPLLQIIGGALWVKPNKIFVIRAVIHKMLFTMSNREDQKQSDQGLHCLPLPFWQEWSRLMEQSDLSPYCLVYRLTIGFQSSSADEWFCRYFFVPCLLIMSAANNSNALQLTLIIAANSMNHSQTAP